MAKHAKNINGMQHWPQMEDDLGGVSQTESSLIDLRDSDKLIEIIPWNQLLVKDQTRIT
jgi:hypothetical protein